MRTPCFREIEQQGNEFYGFRPGAKFVEASEHNHEDCAHLASICSQIDQISRDIYSQMLPRSVRAMEAEIARLKGERDSMPLWKGFQAAIGKSS